MIGPRRPLSNLPVRLGAHSDVSLRGRGECVCITGSPEGQTFQAQGLPAKREGVTVFEKKMLKKVLRDEN